MQGSGIVRNKEGLGETGVIGAIFAESGDSVAHGCCTLGCPTELGIVGVGDGEVRVEESGRSVNCKGNIVRKISIQTN